MDATHDGVKILVLADSHADVDTMLRVAETERPDTIVHLGDHAADGLALRDRLGIPVRLIRGNTDPAGEGEEEELAAFGDMRVYMTHGHLYDVENDLSQLFRAGVRAEARIVLFAHTHKPYLCCNDGVWFMNPGRIGRISRKIIHATYGVIRLAGNRIRCEISEIDQ